MAVTTPTNELDETYKKKKQMLDQNIQQQYEAAYVDRELMNKYLKQNIAQQGLDNSGIANLYAQQANTDYMNTRANIANQGMLAEQELYDAYAAKQEENKKRNLNLALSELERATNDVYGFVDEETMNNILAKYNADNLGENNLSYLNQVASGLKGTEEQLLAYSQDQNAQNLEFEIMDALRENTIGIDEWYQTVEDAYANGEISKEARYDLLDYLDSRNIDKKLAQNSAANDISDKIYTAIGDNGMITSEQKKELEKELKSKRAEIGDDIYDELMGALDDAEEATFQEDSRNVEELYPGTDGDNSVDLYDAKVDSFIDAMGVGKGTEQDKYVQNVLDMIRENPEEYNGYTINFNYGAQKIGDAKAGIWRFYNGRFYKVNNMGVFDLSKVNISSVDYEKLGNNKSTDPYVKANLENAAKKAVGGLNNK